MANAEPLSDAEREKVLVSEYAAQDLRIGGRTFRRWAACDLVSALELGLKIVDPVAMAGLKTAAGRMREFGKLAFLVSLSPEAGEAMAQTPEVFEAAVREFMRTIDPLDFAQVMAWLDRRLSGAAAAAVEVEPKPTGAAGEEPKKKS